ncbi:glycosyltransferase family 2 protein [Geomonas sp. RF6]|uniref:glycosyltransferase family A protein n=1 Tax=Geomonas sp. RF6 TaxID=2897342 RepID=UPI001E3D54F9|nr:glycosyltransferase family A protein [Geomonas sp. RF6]UFS71080.1 glycosyltransferase family 2 protein [Geomonas sp. RF6]
MGKKLVSILIPAYNAQQWIVDTLRSALAQSWPEKEVIVVDDGSRDETLAIARTFQSPSVLVVGQENRGASAARNRALSLAQGEFIQWLDADNMLARDKIERQMKEPQAADERVLLSSPWGFFMYRWQRAHFVRSTLWEDLPPAEWICRKFSGNTFMVPESWLVSRALTERAGRWDEALSLDDDGEYFTRVVSHCDSIRFVDGPKSYYRYANAGSLSSMAYRPQHKLQSQFASISSQIEVLLSLEASGRSTAASLKFLQDSLIYFYPDSPELVRKAEDLARRLGGSLVVPTLGWKYAWLARLFGWKAAKAACFALPAVKAAAQSRFDKMMYRSFSNYALP